MSYKMTGYRRPMGAIQGSSTGGGYAQRGRIKQSGGFSRGMGDINVAGIVGALSSFADIDLALSDAVADPYFPNVVQSILELDAVSNLRPPPDPSQGASIVNGLKSVVTATPGSPGLGLQGASYALDVYVWAKQNPWLFPFAVAAVIGIPMLIGYKMAK